MAITNEFTCPDGHHFKAIAKLRARCTECGKMSTRDFNRKQTSPSQSDSPTESTSKVSSHKVVTPKDTTSGSKPDSITAKVNPLRSRLVKGRNSDSETTKPSSESTRKPVQVVKRGLPAKMPKTVSAPKEPPRKMIAKSRGPVRKVQAKTGHAPTVTRPPKGSRERKVVEALSEEPFWMKVKREYFR